MFTNAVHCRRLLDNMAEIDHDLIESHLQGGNDETITRKLFLDMAILTTRRTDLTSRCPGHPSILVLSL